MDVVSATSSVASANEPVVTIQLKMRDRPHKMGEMPGSSEVGVTLNAASLGALVDGMRRIKDQLASLQ